MVSRFITKGRIMSEAHGSVKQHFEDRKTPRLDIHMLPRDVNRVTGTLRKVICVSFNYVRKYPTKIDKFVEVMRWGTNFALTYKHYMDLDIEAKAKAAEENKVA